jgi:hypothetical protein
MVPCPDAGVGFVRGRQSQGAQVPVRTLGFAEGRGLQQSLDERGRTVHAQAMDTDPHHCHFYQAGWRGGFHKTPIEKIPTGNGLTVT